MTLLSDCGIGKIMTKHVLEVNRAFSVNEFCLVTLGPLPQASSESCAFGAKQIRALSASQMIEVLRSPLQFHSLKNCIDLFT
jgi:hypothetical protein